MRPSRSLLLPAGYAGIPSNGGVPGAEAAAVEGFRLRSDDGTSDLVIGGLFETTQGWFSGERQPSSAASLERMRPEFSGHLGR